MEGESLAASSPLPHPSLCTVVSSTGLQEHDLLSLRSLRGHARAVCAAVSCGPGGACMAGDAPFSYSCECQPGYANLLNLAGLPCVKNCEHGSTRPYV